MGITKLRKRDKRYKRLKRRTARFHRYKVDLAYDEYYEYKKG
jgi:hypothetical protein